MKNPWQFRDFLLSDHSVCKDQTKDDEDLSKKICDHDWEVLSRYWFEEVGIDKD